MSQQPPAPSRLGGISRRTFVHTATGITAGAAAMIARAASAQDATPAGSPAASPVADPVTRSMTRDEYLAQVAEKYTLEAPANPGGQVIQGVAGDITTFNPNLANDNFSLIFCMWMFNALVKTSIVDGTDVPDLADYWEVSADNLTYTFYLNQNAKWHDGNPVTAHDVVFTYEALLQEKSLGIKTSDIRGVVKSFRAIDDYTFEITALAPSPVFTLKAMNMVYVLPKHIWEGIPPEEWASAPASTAQDPAQVIGSGAFKFGEWVPGSHGTVLKNADYWLPDEVPYVDSFTQSLSPEPAAAAQSLIAGEIDILTLDMSQLSIIEPVADQFNMFKWDSLSQHTLWPNQDPARTPLFLDARVRQALIYALDRELTAEQIFQGYATAANGTQPPLSTAYAPDQVTTIYTYDPAKAAALLEEAGWVDADGDGIREKDGVKFSFEILYYQDDQLIPYFQEAWREVGIELVPTKLPFESLLDKLMSGQFEMIQVGWGWTNPDGDQGTLYRCDMWTPNGNNLMRYCNPEYDALNDAQLLEMDPAKRKQLLVDQSNIINDDAACLLLYFLQLAAASGKNVHNYLPSGYLPFWSMNKVWLDAN